jgi:hypothetical protein
MALYLTNTVRVKAGHMQDYAAYAPKVIPIYEKYGVTFLGVFQASPGEANVIVYLVSMRDWAAYGDALQKLQADADFQALQREGGNHVDGNVTQGLVPLPGSSMQ